MWPAGGVWPAVLLVGRVSRGRSKAWLARLLESPWVTSLIYVSLCGEPLHRRGGRSVLVVLTCCPAGLGCSLDAGAFRMVTRSPSWAEAGALRAQSLRLAVPCATTRWRVRPVDGQHRAAQAGGSLAKAEAAAWLRGLVGVRCCCPGRRSHVGFPVLSFAFAHVHVGHVPSPAGPSIFLQRCPCMCHTHLQWRPSFTLADTLQEQCCARPVSVVSVAPDP